MSTQERSRILLVDDEEAILETLEFTFEDDYEVFTATSAARGLEILEEYSPIAAVISDQRMPRMTGVEFFAEVVERFPDTVRIILTGFADMGAIIQAINDGQIYAYISKPWEPDQLKQIVRRAVEHHKLTVENQRLLGNLARANLFLGAVMDRLIRGCIALDADGLVQEANQPACNYLGLTEDPRGKALSAILAEAKRDAVAEVVGRLACEDGSECEEVDLPLGSKTLRLRISVDNLTGAGEERIGHVLFLREVSHEPHRRRFESIVNVLFQEGDGPVRANFEDATNSLDDFLEQLHSSQIVSEGMVELEDSVSRSITALRNWLDVDTAMTTEDFPDAQLLRDRLRIANARWPLAGELPERVKMLMSRVEAYYESGENHKQPTL